MWYQCCQSRYYVTTKPVNSQTKNNCQKHEQIIILHINDVTKAFDCKIEIIKIENNISSIPDIPNLLENCSHKEKDKQLLKTAVLRQ